MIAVWRPLHETWRIVREYGSQSVGSGAYELILADPIPRIEQKRPAGAKHSPGFPESRHLVWKEHHSELAHNRVEAPVAERQRERVGLLPRQSLALDSRRRAVKHRLIEVGCDNIGL